MANRTLGWVQNPADTSKLKDVVAVFEKDSYMHKELINNRIPELLEYNLACDSDTMQRFINLLNKEPLILPYSDLKGKGAGSGGRRTSKCSGIIQAVLPAQKSIEVINKNGETITIKKPYQDNWSADGYLRWAISIGFVDYDSNTDTCFISELGKIFINTERNSDEENHVLGIAYLSYPPVIRILSLLSKGEHLTRYELGSRLGFIGEAGFTSIPQDIIILEYNNAVTDKEKSAVESNLEGTSDKYARMIAGWLYEIGLIDISEKTVRTNIGKKKKYSMDIQSFFITDFGINIYNRFKNYPKIVYYEMLATKISDKDYVRGRRANLIQCLSSKKWKTIEDCIEYLKNKGFDDSKDCIIDDIKGLKSIGIDVIKKGEKKFKIIDEIKKLKIPMGIDYKKTELTIKKDIVRNRLKYVNHKYLVLIDLSYGINPDEDNENNNISREFEIQTIDLLINELSFTGMRLGDSRKPDGIISYDTQGVIIDNKAYSSGYSLPIPQADEMVRYISENQRRSEKENSNKWWKNFRNNVNDFYFLFVSSNFDSKFEERLENISLRTGIKGGAINSQNLLYLAEMLKCHDLSYEDSFKLFENKEIIIE